MNKDTQVNDRRRHKRWSTSRYSGASHIVRAGLFKVYDKDSGEMLGYLIDINADGLRVSGDKNVRKGTELHVHVELPEPIYGQSTIEFGVCCVWSMRDNETDSHHIGFAITSIDEIPTRVIESLIAANTD